MEEVPNALRLRERLGWRRSENKTPATYDPQMECTMCIPSPTKCHSGRDTFMSQFCYEVLSRELRRGPETYVYAECPFQRSCVHVSNGDSHGVASVQDLLNLVCGDAYFVIDFRC